MADTTIPSAVRQAAAPFREPKPMRRGFLTERSMKCGQKECRCHQDAQARLLRRRYCTESVPRRIGVGAAIWCARF